MSHRAGGNGFQVAFALSRITAGGVIAEVHRFADSEVPATLVRGSGGTVYGITSGDYSTAFVFQFTPATGFETIHRFEANEFAASSLVLSQDALYGVGTDRTTNIGFVFRLPLSGSFSKLAEFRDGSAPFAPNDGLVQAPDGTLYGTTTSGGAAGKGTAYKLAPDGVFTLLYDFADQPGLSTPGSLVLAGDGALFGTAYKRTAPSGSVLFRLTTSGVFTTLDIAPANADGSGGSAYHSLSVGPDGVVYGGTGGGERKTGYAFKIAPDGALTKLHDFTGGAEGGYPHHLLQASDGNLYGLTHSGGADRSGTVFRLTPSGSLSVIRNFKFGIFSPVSGTFLVQGADGNLYCATAGESLPHQQFTPGSLFGMTLSGEPSGFRASDITVTNLVTGNSHLYGISAGNYSYGARSVDTVFSCTFSGSLSNLYQFNGSTEGSAPRALLFGTGGSLYGTLPTLGPLGGGAVYELPPKPTGTLRNISTRVAVRSGDDALFAGFIVSGTEPKQVVVRGLGPSLSAAGVPGALANPTLQLFDARGAQIGANDDWSTEFGISETGLAPPSTREAAIVRTLTPGAYSAILRGKADTTGVGLVEVYDLSGLGTPSSALANISSRGLVGTSDNALIAGFIIADQGGGFGRIMARAIGPSLAQAGIQNPLQNPVLQLFDSNGAEIAANDDWRTTSPNEIEETGIPPSADKESAIVVSARAGAYTALVRGVGDTTGTALVEVYALQ